MALDTNLTSDVTPFAPIPQLYEIITRPNPTYTIFTEKTYGCANCHYTGCHECSESTLRQQRKEYIDKLLDQSQLIADMKKQIEELKAEIERIKMSKN